MEDDLAALEKELKIESQTLAELEYGNSKANNHYENTNNGENSDFEQASNHSDDDNDEEYARDKDSPSPSVTNGQNITEHPFLTDGLEKINTAGSVTQESVS